MCNLSTFLGVALGLRSSKRACVWRWGGGWNLDPDRMEVQLQVARGPWSERRACARRGWAVTCDCDLREVFGGRWRERMSIDVHVARNYREFRLRILACPRAPDTGRMNVSIAGRYDTLVRFSLYELRIVHGRSIVNVNRWGWQEPAALSKGEASS